MGAGKVEVVVGGQYGSEGKGNVAGHLAKDRLDLVAVRVAGPNAGHSALDERGQKWALRQIPVMAVTNLDAKLVIAAGSEIDEEVLYHEVDLLDGAGFKVSDRLFVDHQVTIITEDDKRAETIISTGTTGKGIGAARASRAMRDAPIWTTEVADDEMHGRTFDVGTDTSVMLEAHLRQGGDIIIEGTQGFGLGLHAGWYPYCTSSDCRAIDFLAMSGISPWADYVYDVVPWVTLRTFPIRIAGNSGPMLAETSWEDLGLATDGYIKPEFTTVTKKLRRVGGWDPDLARTAVASNGGERCRIALTFFDYWYPELAGITDRDDLKAEHWERLADIEVLTKAKIGLVATGPNSVIAL